MTDDFGVRHIEDMPKRTGDITKLYTGGLGGNDKPFKGKPNDERTNPTKVEYFFIIDAFR